MDFSWFFKKKVPQSELNSQREYSPSVRPSGTAYYFTGSNIYMTDSSYSKFTHSDKFNSELKELQRISEYLNCKIYRFTSVVDYPLESARWQFETELGVIEVTGREVLNNNGTLFSNRVDLLLNAGDKVLNVLYNKILRLKSRPSIPEPSKLVVHVECFHCGREYDRLEYKNVCPGCGSTKKG